MNMRVIKNSSHYYFWMWWREILFKGHLKLKENVVGGLQGVCEWHGWTSIPGKGSDGIMCGWVPVDQSSRLCKWTVAHLHISDLFLQCKSITFLILKLVHQVGGFKVNKGSDGISQVGVWPSEWLGGDVDGTCLAVGKVAGRDPFKQVNKFYIKTRMIKIH